MYDNDKLGLSEEVSVTPMALSHIVRKTLHKSSSEYNTLIHLMNIVAASRAGEGNGSSKGKTKMRIDKINSEIRAPEREAKKLREGIATWKAQRELYIPEGSKSENCPSSSSKETLNGQNNLLYHLLLANRNYLDLVSQKLISTLSNDLFHEKAMLQTYTDHKKESKNAKKQLALELCNIDPRMYHFICMGSPITPLHSLFNAQAKNKICNPSTPILSLFTILTTPFIALLICIAWLMPKGAYSQSSKHALLGAESEAAINTICYCFIDMEQQKSYKANPHNKPSLRQTSSMLGKKQTRERHFSQHTLHPSSYARTNTEAANIEVRTPNNKPIAKHGHNDLGFIAMLKNTKEV